VNEEVSRETGEADGKNPGVDSKCVTWDGSPKGVPYK